jgi:hypothetical protein
MITLDENTKNQLIELYKERNIGLEGNILKVISGDDDEFKKYLELCIEHDISCRKKRLEITKKIQEQNRELIEWKEKNENVQKELEYALIAANKAKANAENNLDVLIKKNQNEMVNQIVRTSLIVILGVGTLTTMLYFYTLYKGIDNQIIESSWANMFSILLTNSFSIIGTIMGVKHMQNIPEKTKN